MKKKKVILSYKLSGKKGPVVVLFHAFPLLGGMWDSQRQELGQIARVLVPDFPGLGRSKSVKAGTIQEMARQVAVLLENLSIKEPVMVAGLSMGGYVVLEFVRLFPSRVKALGLFATRASADSPEQKIKRYEAVKNVRAHGIAPLVRAMIPKLLGKTSLSSRQDVVRMVQRKMVSATDSAGVMNALLAMAKRRDNTSYLEKIKCPALILAGKEDNVIPLDEMRLLKEKIKSSKFFIFPKAGHLLNLEEPSRFNKLLSQFVKKLR